MSANRNVHGAVRNALELAGDRAEPAAMVEAALAAAEAGIASDALRREPCLVEGRADVDVLGEAVESLELVHHPVRAALRDYRG